MLRTHLALYSPHHTALLGPSINSLLSKQHHKPHHDASGQKSDIPRYMSDEVRRLFIQHKVLTVFFWPQYFLKVTLIDLLSSNLYFCLALGEDDMCLRWAAALFNNRNELVDGQCQILCPKRSNGDYNNAVSCDGPHWVCVCARVWLGATRSQRFLIVRAYETPDEIDKKKEDEKRCDSSLRFYCSRKPTWTDWHRLCMG